MKPHFGVPGTRLFDIGFSSLTFAETMKQIETFCDLKSPEKLIIFTANVDHVVRFHDNPEFRNAYRRASLITADGAPIVFAARLFGRSIPERVTGIDLMEEICKLGVERHLRFFLLGASPDVAQLAAVELERRFKGIKMVGFHHGYFDHSSKIIDQINEQAPDVLFVGMGSPRQEIWVDRFCDQLNCRLILPVGGSFDVAAGKVRRSPKLLQRAGLEWMWRLFWDFPRLWKRYLIEDSKFLLHLVRQSRSLGSRIKRRESD